MMAVLAATPVTDPVSFFVNYGALGVLLILIITGQLHTKAEISSKDKQIEDKDKDIAAKDQMIKDLLLQITGTTLPAISRSAQVMEALPRKELEVTQHLQEQLQDMQAALVKLTAASASDHKKEPS